MNEFDAYIKSAVAQADSSHPDWRTQSGGRPICIPPALDQNTFFHAPLDGDEQERKLAAKYRRRIVGDNSELFVFSAFQATQKLGGILIADFKMQDFKKDRLCRINKDIADFCKNDIQLDFVYLHRQLGILVIEVKNSSDAVSGKSHRNLNETYDPYKEALDKLTAAPKNYVQTMTNLLQILTDSNSCNVPVPGVICFPNADMSSKPEPPGIWHIDTNAIHSEHGLETLLLGKIQASQDYFSFENFDQFASVLMSYRELVFLREGDSALTMSRMIQAQKFFPKNADTQAIESFSIQQQNKCTAIYLNPSQRHCLHANEKRKILYGLPGTGKTVLVMLHILKAAKHRKYEDRDIAYQFGTSRLVLKYKDLESSIMSEWKKSREGSRPKFHAQKNLDNVPDYCDFFADEVPAVFGEWERFLERRSKLDNVYTVVAISGRSWADDIQMISQNIVENKALQEYSKFPLDVVVRGTKNIINYWADNYLSHWPNLPNSSHWSHTRRAYLPDKVRIGHNIHGEVVEEIKTKTTTELLSEILRHVQKLLGIDRVESGFNWNAHNAQLRPCDIALLTINKRAAHFIIRHLNANGFETEHTGGKNNFKIKVDRSNKVLSQEYPVVIMVNYYGYERTGEAMELIFASRAMSRLIVLDRDRMIIQREVDNILKCSVKITSKVIRQAVKKAAKKINEAIGEESGDSALVWDEALAHIRYNTVPDEVRKISVALRDCRNFSDVFHVLQKDTHLLNDLVRTNVIEDTLYFSVRFTANRLANRDRSARLDLLDIKDARVHTALLSFYKTWKTHMQKFLDLSPAERGSAATSEENRIWQPITRVLMTLG